jgi:hypothetical protein
MENEKERTEVLGAREIESLREAIQQGVIGVEGLEAELEESPEAYLRLVARSDLALGEATRLLHEAVTQARRAGHSWAVIGAQLGISRQAAQQRFGPGADASDAFPAEVRKVGATAINEMAILKSEGRAGNHLVSFGAGYLLLESSERRWEHMRVTTIFMGDLKRQLERAGWEYVGTWFPFRYFKRALPE